MIWILIFHPSRIPDPGVKKAPDPGSGSGSATLAELEFGIALNTISIRGCEPSFFLLN
jgi:hypothetical protein